MTNRCKDLIENNIIYNIAIHPYKTAVKINNEMLSYWKLDQLSNQIIGRLFCSCKEEMNLALQKTDNTFRIGVFLPRNCNLISSIWAICKLGYTYVPLDPEIPLERIKFIIQDCNISVILTETAFAAYFENVIVIDLLDLPLINKVNEVSLVEMCNPYPKIAYIIYTSGTTGKPKGVPITYDNLYNLLQNVSKSTIFNLSMESRILGFASINFDASIIEIFGSLFVGGTLIIANEQQRHDMQLLSHLLNEEKVTFLTLPSSLAVLMPDLNYSTLDTLVIAGEKMPACVAQRLSGKNFRLVNAYGPTENTVMTTMREVSFDVDAENIGWAIPGVIVHVVCFDLTPVEVNEVGELCIGGKQLADGYLGNPALNQKYFIPNPFLDVNEAPMLYKTGDLVRLMPDGSYNFIGRKDSQVKFNGYRIELSEIIQQIEKCEGIAQAYVLVENREKGKYLVAYIKLSNGNSLDIIKNAREKLRKFLPHYMIPSFWIPIAEFPLTINGKIDTKELIKLSIQPQRNEIETRTMSEDLFAHIVAGILGHDDIGIDDDLFDKLGLTSIQVMQLPIELELFGIYVSVKDIYSKRTIREILNNNIRSLSYWFNEPVPDKPVLVLVSGYTSFSFLYGEMVKSISDLYSIFVFESYHEYPESEVCSCETLILSYLKILLPIAREYKITVITGFCLGGELGLYLANEFYKETGLLPHVVVLDGEVGRSKIMEENIPLYLDILSDKLNAYRVKRDMALVKSMPDFRYKGSVTSILADHFMSDLTPFSKKIFPSKKQEDCARLFYERAPYMWKKYYPNCELLYVDADHWSYFHTKENTEAIIAYFRSLIK